MANDRPIYLTFGQYAQIPATDFVDPGAGVQFPNGSAVAPSAAFATNNGFFYDTTNLGPGLAIAGVQIGWLNASGLTVSIAGGGLASVLVMGEGTTPTIGVQKFSNDANAANNQIGKGRGTIASKAVPVLNDVLGIYSIAGWNGSGLTNACRFYGTLIETGTVGPTAMGGRAQISCAAIGAGGQTEVVRFEVGTGFSMFGANPVVDQNRTVIFNSSTVSTLPTLVTGGNRFVTDLEGGQGNVYGGALAWRNEQNGQIAVNTVTGQGVLSKFTGYCSFSYRAIVNNTMQKLSDAGLLSGKLLGLWVHAVPTNSTDALLNWITPGTRNAAIVGTPTWTANQGFTGDGSSALIDSGASLTTFGATQNNVSVGTYVRTAGTGSAKAVIGCDNVALARRMYLQTFTSGALVARCNDQTNDNYTPGQYTGMFVMSRGLAASFNASVNDAAATTVTRTSVTQTSAVAFLGTADSTGSEFSNAQISFSFIGIALSATDIANLTAILVDYYLVQMGAASVTVAGLPPAVNFSGQTLYVPDLGGGAALLESDGTNWFRTGFDGYETRGITTGSETITYLTNASTIEYNGTLVANTTVTLATTDAKGTAVKNGAVFYITRTGSGAFNLSIGGLKNLTTNTWCKVGYNAGAWHLLQYGSL